MPLGRPIALNAVFRGLTLTGKLVNDAAQCRKIRQNNRQIRDLRDPKRLL